MSNDNKNILFIEANIMYSAAKVQLYPPYSFWEYAFFIFFHKTNLSVAMRPNQIEVFGQEMKRLVEI